VSPADGRPSYYSDRGWKIRDEVSPRLETSGREGGGKERAMKIVVADPPGRPRNSYETIPPVRLESSGDVLSTVDMVVQRRDGPRRLRDHDDDDDDDDRVSKDGNAV